MLPLNIWFSRRLDPCRGEVAGPAFHSTEAELLTDGSETMPYDLDQFNTDLLALIPPGKRELFHDSETDAYVLAHVQVPGKGVPHSHGASWAVYGNVRGATQMTEWCCLNPEAEEGAVIVEAAQPSPVTSPLGKEAPSKIRAEGRTVAGGLV
jgi:hypothetical protein